MNTASVAKRIPWRFLNLHLQRVRVGIGAIRVPEMSDLDDLGDMNPSAGPRGVYCLAGQTLLQEGQHGSFLGWQGAK